MALNVLYQGVEENRRPQKVGENVEPGTPLIIGGRPVVTVTGSGKLDSPLAPTGDDTIDTMLGINDHRGGESLADDYATVAPDGSYFFDVIGSTIAVAPQATVYFDDTDGTLTLTDTGVKFGIVEFFRGTLSATDTAVTIGVNLG